MWIGRFDLLPLDYVKDERKPKAVMNIVSNLHRYSLSVALLCLLSACSDPGMGDLRAYVDKIKARENKKVEPLEPIKLVESFFYTAHEDNLRSPFESFINEGFRDDSQTPEPGTVADCPRPDPNRHPEPLENYPLDSLRMVGVFSDSEGYAYEALIEDPDGITHRVRQGNYLGENHGRVEFISPIKLEVRELEADGQGCFRERAAELAVMVE